MPPNYSVHDRLFQPAKQLRQAINLANCHFHMHEWLYHRNYVANATRVEAANTLSL